eukprot:COSAG06_NODE_2287_length_7155_cov_20.776927_8_plen_350_part_00
MPIADPPALRDNVPITWSLKTAVIVPGRSPTIWGVVPSTRVTATPCSATEPRLAGDAAIPSKNAFGNTLGPCIVTVVPIGMVNPPLKTELPIVQQFSMVLMPLAMPAAFLDDACLLSHLICGLLPCRYRADSVCFAWELIMLEVRFLTIFIGWHGKYAADPITSASLVIAITLLGLLIMQACLKPFRESVEEAAHWSSCNKMAAVGYISQLVVLAVGLLSIILADSLSNAVEVLLTLVAVVALLVPLMLTGKIFEMNKATYVSVATSVIDNVLSDAVGGSDSDPSTGDRVTWTKSDDDIPIGLVGEVQGPAHDGRLSVEFNGTRFNFRPEELVLATATTSDEEDRASTE